MVFSFDISYSLQRHRDKKSNQMSFHASTPWMHGARVPSFVIGHRTGPNAHTHTPCTARHTQCDCVLVCARFFLHNGHEYSLSKSKYQIKYYQMIILGGRTLGFTCHLQTLKYSCKERLCATPELMESSHWQSSRESSAHSSRIMCRYAKI